MTWKLTKSVMAFSYRDTLDSSDSVRYDTKLSLLGNRDPCAFEHSDWTDDVSLLPSTTYIDITNYLVICRVKKTLDAYNQFVCGWVRVREKQLCLKEDYCDSVVTARVFTVKLCLCLVCVCNCL